jgi:hypothetical protein
MIENEQNLIIGMIIIAAVIFVITFVFSILFYKDSSTYDKEFINWKENNPNNDDKKERVKYAKSKTMLGCTSDVSVSIGMFCMLIAVTIVTGACKAYYYHLFDLEREKKKQEATNMPIQY